MIVFKFPTLVPIQPLGGGGVRLPCSRCGQPIDALPAFADGAIAVVTEVICKACIQKNKEGIARELGLL